MSYNVGLILHTFDNSTVLQQYLTSKSNSYTVGPPFPRARFGLIFSFGRNCRGAKSKSLSLQYKTTKLNLANGNGAPTVSQIS